MVLGSDSKGRAVHGPDAAGLALDAHPPADLVLVGGNDDVIGDRGLAFQRFARRRLVSVAGTSAVGTRAARPVAVATDLLPHLRRARDHIDRHYSQALDLDQLSRVAGISKYHFARSFEATYGETPIRYLTRRRIERAQDLLRVANLTVTEVCMLVGFASLGSFSSRFTQLVGESPTAYRDHWAARGGPHIPGCYLFMRCVQDLSATAGPGSGPAR